jgi:iron complex outermembrane receptor protein
MKNKAVIFAFALIALFTFESIAANKGPKKSGPVTQSTLSGVILDKDSNEKLAGVTIQLTSTDQKIYTNSKGEFTIDGIEPGTYTVKVNCISYKDKEVTVKIEKAQDEKVKILLNPIMP